MTDQRQQEAAKAESAIPLYRRVIAEVRPFLGAESEKFVIRQIAHLRILPEQLSADHIVILASWVENSARLILNRDKATELYQNIIALEK